MSSPPFGEVVPNNTTGEKKGQDIDQLSALLDELDDEMPMGARSSIGALIDKTAQLSKCNSDMGPDLGKGLTALCGDFDKAMKFLREEIVGRNRILDGPFGPRLKVYMDYTASGQGVRFINKYMGWIRENFANTHTEDSTSGRFMTGALHAAYDSLARCVHATDDFVVICTGTGCTGGLLRLQQVLGIYIPPACWSKLGLLLKANPPQTNKVGQSSEPIQMKILPSCSVFTPGSDCMHSEDPAKARVGYKAACITVVGKSPVWLQAREEVKRILRNAGQLPLVVVGGFEHHSNELSWREGLCDVARVPLTKSFELDLEALTEILETHRTAAPNRQIIGSLSACSNVTGMKTDLPAVSKILRRFGASFFVDYAASGPYEHIDCCPKGQENLFDGFVCSPHKFLGGDGSCGILVLRKSMYNLRLPPTFAGGGTVKLVGQEFHSYVDDIQERENAGTPGALQTFQCALAFELKDSITARKIEEKEKALVADVFGWVKEKYPKEVFILGNQNPALRHAIVSFNIVGPWPLHPRYVTVLLSDLFGVQTRAGCSCAGPHGVDLLGVSVPRMKEWVKYMVGGVAHGTEEDMEDTGLYSIKPGWCRFNLHYTMDADELWYFKEVLSFVVQHGARFLSVYSFDAMSGGWEFKPPSSFQASLTPHHGSGSHHLGIKAAMEGGTSQSLDDSGNRRSVLQQQLNSANTLLERLPKDVKLMPPPAPFPDINLPSHGPQPFFVIAEGQIHNYEEMKQCMSRIPAMPVPAQVALAAPDSEKVAVAVAEKPTEEKCLVSPETKPGMVTPVTLEWKELSFSVAVRGGKVLPSDRDGVRRSELGIDVVPAQLEKQPSSGRKDILSSVSGIAKPGQMLCILGPSGAGKTTLLDALCNRIRTRSHRTLSGWVKANGQPLNSSFRFTRSYVAQQHSLYWMFSVRETLFHAADLLMPWSTPYATKLAKVQDVITTLGLEPCANTKVGLPFIIRGLSGGQLKRLSIGVELLANPSVLILDEPTSSLDSFAAAEIMRYLSLIAGRDGRTVIATIHQPSTQIWETFDQLCFLTGGKVAFFGAREEAVPFFGSIGHACPTYSNPADFFLQILNTDFDTSGKAVDAENICGGFANSDEGRRLAAALDKPVTGEVPIHRTYANNGLVQFIILMRHLFIKNLKDPGIFWVRFVMYTALSVLVAALFWDLGDKTSLASVQSRLALNFYVAAFFVFMAIVAAPQLIEDRQVFIRERSNGYYSVLPYCLANYLTILPGLALIAAVTGAIIIPSTGLMPFADYFYMMFPALAVAEGIVNVFSACAPHYIVSSAGIAMLNGGFMLVEGFMQVKSDIPDYFVWMHHMAYHTYAFRLAMAATFKPITTLNAGSWSNGLDVLTAYEMEDMDETADLTVLICYAVVLQVMFIFIMWLVHDGRH